MPRDEVLSMQVLVEKELRRQLLELDEHSGHLAQQLEVMTHHSMAMHTLTTGAYPQLSTCT